jgi:hypothetical protein
LRGGEDRGLYYRRREREGPAIMARKLKTYITNLGFFELA